MSTTPPKHRNAHPRRRTVVWLLVGVAVLYAVGLGAVLVRYSDLEIVTNITDRLSSLAQRIRPAEDVSDVPTADTDQPAPTTPKKQPIFLREEPVTDNMPESPLLEPKLGGGPPDGSAPSHPPPAELPAGVFVGEGLKSVKCWDKKGFEHDRQGCDKLASLEKQIIPRLYIADTCRKEILGPLHTGKLSIAMEADFVRNTLSVWEGDGSTLHYSHRVAACFSEALTSLSVRRLSHAHPRYRLQLDIAFGRPTRLANREVVSSADQETIKAFEQAVAAAELVKVVKTRVRVRKTPVDGHIIGFVSAPAKVRLIEQKGEWCLVKTKRGNVGWIVCWGLEIP